MTRFAPVILAFSLIIITTMSALASPVNSKSDAEIERRAHEVSRALRCVVCQNQSIDESDAALAGDMRALVRVRLKAGDSNDDVIAFMQERYGDYVLLKPPVQRNTYILWLAPFGFLALILIWFLRPKTRAPLPVKTVAPLTNEEIGRLKKLVDEGRNEGDGSRK